MSVQEALFASSVALGAFVYLIGSYIVIVQEQKVPLAIKVLGGLAVGLLFAGIWSGVAS